MLTSLMLAGCSQSQDAASSNELTSSDFEHFDGWLGNSAGALTKDQAHSGKYSTVVAPGQDYSLGYSNELGKLSPNWPSKITVGAWILSAGQTSAKMVIEVKPGNDNRPPLVWEGVDLSKAVTTFNKWQYVESTITMPAAAKPTSLLKVYLWGASTRQPVYLDDLKISLAQ
ncbi:hypothetical protein [Hymenobacter sp. YC55]|uniref:hypothetical protein n=1 Tax=Hymenobacter sp. YC55 TaxID=3034019 RepID=UPI0023F64225|nr:hypothetical protein [Hymenobacter sp. YC55]MDF7812735.1 hypothetical protein [Hymenobacter sp. YC55]